MNNIPYGRQSINESDINAVVEVLRSEYLTQGEVVPRFENSVANYVGVEHAVAVNSATSALHIACLALGLNQGDWLWTTAISFVASANCGVYCGANIDFIDIDPKTYNLCTIDLERKLSIAESKGILPKIVVAVHMSGQSCDMNAIRKLSVRYGFKVIEDASHAIGGKYKNERIGSCRYSDITIFSFHPVKIITTGEGGIAVTKVNAYAKTMKLLRSHGINRDINEYINKSDGPWYYEQTNLGFNYRMTDIQAALGLSQMSRIDNFVQVRNEIASRYNELLNDQEVIIPWLHPDNYSSYHLYIIRIDSGRKNYSKLTVFETLRSLGIGVNLHYIPIYKHPYFSRKGYDSKNFPNSELYYSEAVSLPIFPLLTNKQQQFVVMAIKDILKI